MSSTIAVFGAGPGLGRSIARRFGQEGFQVALVARTATRLNAMVEELSAEGIEAAAFPADLTNREALPATVAAITKRFGHIDVLAYSPSGLDWLDHQTDVRTANVDSFEFPLDLLLRAPVTLVQEVLPGMLERNQGTLLFGLAVTASRPYPQLGNVSTAAAAARAYAQNLNVSLADTGIYAGLLQVAGMITNSEAANYVIANRDPSTLPKPLDPADLAEACWTLHTKRDRFEQTIP
jgi:NADP-dependent 3-hydroxy acid dehydrogenase YdfG